MKRSTCFQNAGHSGVRPKSRGEALHIPVSKALHSASCSAATWLIMKQKHASQHLHVGRQVVSNRAPIVCKANLVDIFDRSYVPATVFVGDGAARRVSGLTLGPRSTFFFVVV